MQKALRYGAGLIALYLVAFYATGAGQVINASSNGASGVIRALQGRS